MRPKLSDQQKEELQTVFKWVVRHACSARGSQAHGMANWPDGLGPLVSSILPYLHAVIHYLLALRLMDDDGSGAIGEGWNKGQCRLLTTCWRVVQAVEEV